MSGRVIHIGQVVIDLPLRITALPEPGGEVFADESAIELGGGYNVLVAARRMAAPTVFAGTLGNGPFSQIAASGLAAIGVEHVGARVDSDLGYCVVITDAQAERTFISTTGAETRDPVDAFDGLDFGGDDVLYVSGYSLAQPANAAALVRLAGRIARAQSTGADRPGTVVVDVCPMIGSADSDGLEALRALHPIWSMNDREARILAARLGLGALGGDHADAARALSASLGSVVLRAGARGSWYAADGGLVRTPSIPVHPVDTNGAGDAHSGVLAAALAGGVDIARALRWANVAGALSTTRPGPATCPTREEILDCAVVP